MRAKQSESISELPDSQKSGLTTNIRAAKGAAHLVPPPMEFFDPNAALQAGLFQLPSASTIAPAITTTVAYTGQPSTQSAPDSPPENAPDRGAQFTTEQNANGGSSVLPMPANSLPADRPIASSQVFHVPFDSGRAADDVQLSSVRDRISITAHQTPLNKLMALIAEQHGLNVVCGSDVDEEISVSLTDTPLSEALDAILVTNGYTWTRQKNIVIVSKISSDNKSAAAAQGRAVQVYSLNYVAATDVDKVVKGLLSPVGQSFINESSPADHRRAHEQLIVEDLPPYLHRISDYLAQVDTPPRQVLIEAHVLQVTLKDNCRHGVNLQNLARIANSDVTLQTEGLISGIPPSSSLKIQGADLEGILEAIKATTDAKTLASPKVAVLNNQQASLQVGAKIGYLLTTTTQTSSLQSVNFLDVGVILKVLPSITADGQVLINVNPQVSTGRINPTNQLPESETTEVSSSVLLADGEAIVIGGLIKETDSDSRNKVPILGDLWLVGWLFQRRETTRERNEIIITILPRILSDEPGCRSLDPMRVQQAQTPLLYGDLESMNRTRFEPQLPCYSVRPANRPVYSPPAIQPTPSAYPTFQQSSPSRRIFITPEPYLNEEIGIPQVGITPGYFNEQINTLPVDTFSPLQRM